MKAIRYLIHALKNNRHIDGFFCCLLQPAKKFAGSKIAQPE